MKVCNPLFFSPACQLSATKITPHPTVLMLLTLLQGNHAWVLATLLAAMLAVAVAQGQATDTTPGPAAVAEAAEREDPPAAAKPAAKEEPTTAEATAAPAKPAAKEDRPAGSGGAQTAAAAMDPMAGDPADREEARASSRAAPRQKSGAGAEGGAARGVGDQQQAQPAAAQQQAQQPEEEDGDYDAESEEQVQAVVAKPVEQVWGRAASGRICPCSSSCCGLHRQQVACRA